MTVLTAASFQALLADLKHTLGTKSVLPIHGAICFRDGKALSYDGQTGCVIKTALADELRCCVPGDELIDLVDKLKDDIDVSLAGNTLHIHSGGLKAKIKTFSYVDFPEFIPQDRSELTADDPALMPALEAVLPFIGKELNALGGVCIVQDKVYGSTGQTVTKALLTKKITDMVHLPDKFVKALVKLGNPTCLFRARDLVGAFWEAEGRILITSQIVARFPHEQVDTVFRVAGPEKVFPDDTAAVCKRIAASLTDTEWVEVTQQDNQLKIASKTAYEILPWEAPNFTCKVNLKRLLGSLKVTSRVALGSVVSGENRSLVFMGDNFMHALALGE